MRNTVKNILKQNGFDPGPQRGVGTWDEFLKLHAATLWQSDFFSKKILTIKGFRDAFVLVFLHVETRRVFVTPATQHPNQAWIEQQAQAFVEHIKQTGLGADIVMHDRDTKFTTSFDAALKRAKLRIVKTAFRSPNILAFAERFIQTLGQECLDYFIPVRRAASESSRVRNGGPLSHRASSSIARQRLVGAIAQSPPQKASPETDPRANDNARGDRLQATPGGLAAALLPQGGVARRSTVLPCEPIQWYALIENMLAAGPVATKRNDLTLRFARHLAGLRWSWTLSLTEKL